MPIKLVRSNCKRSARVLCTARVHEFAVGAIEDLQRTRWNVELPLPHYGRAKRLLVIHGYLQSSWASLHYCGQK
jgi:hypothetical protein